MSCEPYRELKFKNSSNFDAEILIVTKLKNTIYQNKTENTDSVIIKLKNNEEFTIPFEASNSYNDAIVEIAEPIKSLHIQGKNNQTNYFSRDSILHLFKTNRRRTGVVSSEILIEVK